MKLNKERTLTINIILFLNLIIFAIVAWVIHYFGSFELVRIIILLNFLVLVLAWLYWFDIDKRIIKLFKR